MKKLSRWVVGVSALAVAWSTAGAAEVGTYNMSVNFATDGLYGSSAGISASLYNAVGDPIRSYNRWFGAFQATDTNSEDAWYSFCTDFTAYLQLGTYDYQIIPVTSTSPGASEGWVDWSVDGMQAAAAIYKNNVGGMAANRQAYGAALQLAIWEALYDTGNVYDKNAGRFQANIPEGQVLTYYNTFLTSLTSSDEDIDFAGVQWLKPDPRRLNGNGRAVQGNLRLVSVPEPAMLLSSLLALGLAWVGRRRLV